MAADGQFMDHRWGTRLPLDVPAELRLADGTVLQVLLMNASISGAFMYTSTAIPLLSRVALRPAATAAPLSHGPWLQTSWIEAYVTRDDPAGLGLEWIDPDLQSVCALLALSTRYITSLQHFATKELHRYVFLRPSSVPGERESRP